MPHAQGQFELLGNGETGLRIACERFGFSALLIVEATAVGRKIEVGRHVADDPRQLLVDEDAGQLILEVIATQNIGERAFTARQQLYFLAEGLGPRILEIDPDLVAGEIGVLGANRTEIGVTGDRFERDRPKVIGEVSGPGLAFEIEHGRLVGVDQIGVAGCENRHTQIGRGDGRARQRIEHPVAVAAARIQIANDCRVEQLLTAANVEIGAKQLVAKCRTASAFALRIVEFERRREGVVRLEQQRGAEVAIVVIEQIAAERIDVLHIAVGLFVRPGKAQRDRVAERGVDKQVAAKFPILAHGNVGAAKKALERRLRGGDRDIAAKRVAAIERTLRPALNFDALNIDKAGCRLAGA